MQLFTSAPKEGDKFVVLREDPFWTEGVPDGAIGTVLREAHMGSRIYGRIDNDPDGEPWYFRWCSERDHLIDEFGSEEDAEENGELGDRNRGEDEMWGPDIRPLITVPASEAVA